MAEKDMTEEEAQYWSDYFMKIRQRQTRQSPVSLHSVRQTVFLEWIT